MKKLLLTSFAAAFLLQAKAQTFSHAIVPVTGFTADVIADGSGSAATSTTADVDGQNYNFMAQNFVNPTNQSPTSFLPASGLINSLATPGLPFQLAPYTGNNSLRLTTTANSGTLTFATPRTADKINLLVTTAFPSTFTATVNFSDATTQDFTGNSVPNWFDGASPAIQGIGRVLRTTNVIENSTTNPRMYQYALTLSATNAAKTIQSITFTKTTTVATEILHVFAVTASTAIPNDAGISAITAPVSPVAPGVSQAVSVTVKNYGATALNGATIGWSVNKVAQPNFTFTSAPALATNAVSPAVPVGNFSFPFGIHTVKAWTKLPNGVADGLIANDTAQVTIFSCNPLTGNFTINKNNPASATNFQSFAMAVQALTSCGVGGPVTFTVAPNSGPYIEQVTLPVFAGTSATNTVTFEGNGNTITAVTTTAKPGIITFSGADFVKINNFKINVDVASPTGWGVQLISASDNDIISNCTINMPVSVTTSAYNGIWAGTSTAQGNYANNLLIENNIIEGGYQGITIVGTTTGTTTTGNRIIGNQVRNFYAYGIYIATGGTGTIIESNDISRPNRVNGGAMYGIFLTGATTNTIVNKNRIHNTHDKTTNTANFVYGIYSLAPATIGNENIIKNNVIYNLNNYGGSITAFYNSSAHGTYYYHNTVTIDDPNMAFNVVKGIHFTAASTNVKFINNILSMSAIAGTKHAIYLANTGVVLVSNNNDLFVGLAGNIGYYSAADKATLVDWKTVNTNAYDQNSISVDPVFANQVIGNLRPLVTALDNGGQAVAAVTEDINGIIRSTTTPDMGAYEFTPAVNDAGITAINSPTSPVTPGSQAVHVTLRNFGTAALATATISWKVNGLAQPDYAWSGNLASLAATTTPVNIGNFNFVGGNYTIKVWSKNPNGAIDPLAANDTTILNVVSCTPLAGNYTINKNNPTAGTNFQSIAEATQKLNSCGVSGPVTFTVTSGTGPYNEQVEILNIPFTSATNTVTFEGSGNIVSAIPAIGKPGIIVLNGVKYTKVNNFVITLPATATIGWGVQLVNAADYNTISNNTINLPLTINTSDVNGIVAGSVVQTAGNNSSNSKILNNIINGGFNCIQLNGVAGGLLGNNNQIVGNQLKDFFAYGIYLLNGNGTLIEGNDISRPLRTNGFGLSGIYLTGTCMSTTISKNRIHNCHDAQPTGAGSIYGVYTASAATAGSENIVKNNLVYNMNNTNSGFIGFYNSGGNGSWYYHNTVMSDPAITYGFMSGIRFSSASTNVKFINNIISLPSNSSNKHAIYMSSATTPLVSNNNDIFIGTNANSYTGYAAGNINTLADWKLLNSAAFDQNSVAIDPVFAAPATGNLKPTALTMDNLGQPVPAVTDDILGLTRNSTTPDMGAYEFGTLPDDAGITAITAPNSGCSLTNAETVTITINNFGPAALTSVPVSYTVNGGTAVNETFTGSIAAGATANYSFTAKANLAAPGSYVIVATASLANDGVASNNSFTKTVVASTPAAVPTVTAGGPVALCTGGSVVLTAASTTTGATYAWYRNGTALTGATSATYTANVAGSYTAVATANGCPSAYSAVTTVTINAIPATPTISQAGFVLTSSSATGNQWYLNGTAIPGATGATYTTTANGSYTVMVTTNGCSSTVSAAVTIVNTGIKDDQNLAVAVYPNPSEGLVNVNLPKGQSYEIQVTDLTGKVILTEKVMSSKTQLNLSKVAKGIYLLKVSGEKGAAVRKLIIE